jgi:hypothetical protein
MRAIFERLWIEPCRQIPCPESKGTCDTLRISLAAWEATAFLVTHQI